MIDIDLKTLIWKVKFGKFELLLWLYYMQRETYMSQTPHGISNFTTEVNFGREFQL